MSRLKAGCIALVAVGALAGPAAGSARADKSHDASTLCNSQIGSGSTYVAAGPVSVGWIHRCVAASGSSTVPCAADDPTNEGFCIYADPFTRVGVRGILTFIPNPITIPLP